MTYRDDEDALRARIAELENKMNNLRSGHTATKLRERIAALSEKIVRLEAQRDDARYERDRARLDHEHLAATHRKVMIPKGFFQRSTVFFMFASMVYAGIAIGAYLACHYLLINLWP